jgi:hypothetical protein
MPCRSSKVNATVAEVRTKSVEELIFGIMECEFNIDPSMPAINGMTTKRRDSACDPEICSQLTKQTRKIQAYPYDPEGWLKRAQILEGLGFPELAVGDAHKAQMLCDEVQSSEESNYVLGYKMGFRILMDDDRIGCETFRTGHASRIERNLHDYRQLIAQLCRRNSHYTPRQYPWTKSEHRYRDDAQLNTWNAELLANGRSNPKGPCCIIKRDAFGDNRGRAKESEVLGVCATRSIAKGEIVLTDPARFRVSISQ